MKKTQKRTTIATIKKAWSLLGQQEKRNALWVGLIMLVAATAATMMVGAIFPFLAVLANPDILNGDGTIARIYAASGLKSPESFLVALGAMTTSVIVGANAIQLVRVYAISRFFIRRGHAIGGKIFKGYMNAPYEIHLGRNSAEMTRRITSEVSEIVNGVMRPAADLVAASMTGIFILVFLLWFNTMATVAGATIIGGAYLLITLKTRHTIQKIGEERTEAARRRQRIITETLSGMREIKLGGHEARAMNSLMAQSSIMGDHEIKSVIMSDAPRYGMQALFFGGGIVACLLVIDWTNFGSGGALMDIVPMMGVFAMAGQRLIPEMHMIFSAINRMRFNTMSLENVSRDIAMAAETEKNRPKIFSAINDPIVIGETAKDTMHIALKDVSYTYPGSAIPILSGITIDILPGERIGVIGPTGSGKTTLANILLGLLHPSSGEVVINGEGAVAGDKKRNGKVAAVPQDVFLIDGSIAENIAFGDIRNQGAMKRVIACARMACLESFVEGLDKKYDTPVGERGVQISGGQRQRIGIARALFQNASFIVMDEATSALDSHTEKSVMKAIDSIPGDKTLVLIAHRLETVRRCDRILLLENGKVSAFGGWDELVDTNAAFRNFVQSKNEPIQQNQAEYDANIKDHQTGRILITMKPSQ